MREDAGTFQSIFDQYVLGVAHFFLNHELGNKTNFILAENLQKSSLKGFDKDRKRRGDDLRLRHAQGIADTEIEKEPTSFLWRKKHLSFLPPPN